MNSEWNLLWIDDVAAWADHNFPTETPETVVLGLAEEVGEMCRAALKRYQGIRGSRAEWDVEIRKESGDVFIKLVHVAHVHGFDLLSAIQSRWGDVSQRDWRANPIGHGLPDER